MDLEKVINSNNLCIANNKSPTYLNPSTSSYSASNITLYDPLSYMDYIWKVHNIIILEITQSIHNKKTNRLIGKNLKSYAIEDWLVQDPNSTVLIKHFTETLIAIANETILKTSPSNRCHTLWFNNECKIAI